MLVRNRIDIPNQVKRIHIRLLSNIKAIHRAKLVHNSRLHRQVCQRVFQSMQCRDGNWINIFEKDTYCYGKDKPSNLTYSNTQIDRQGNFVGPTIHFLFCCINNRVQILRLINAIQHPHTELPHNSSHFSFCLLKKIKIKKFSTLPNAILI